MTDLNKYPPAEQWHDWTELDAKAWPDKVEKNYTLVPTTCFNCEAGCGLVAYHDKETGEIRKIEGNPHHPGSRGRNSIPSAPKSWEMIKRNHPSPTSIA